MIHYGKHHITDEDIVAVTTVLKQQHLTQGNEVSTFEQSFNEVIKSKYSIAVSNGTAALHLALKALGVRQGSRVITTPITFAATSNSVIYCGGEVEFCDINKNTYLLDLEKLEELLQGKPDGYYDGVIAVHFGGLMVDTEKLKKITDRYGLWILEDACHAPGASFIDSNGIKINAGECSYSDGAIFSFHPVKHIACGEGGMVTTSNETIAETVRLLRSHGITKNPEQVTHIDGVWYYEMHELGYNYRLTDFQCALGNSQLKRLAWSVKERNKIANRYIISFKDLPIKYQKYDDLFHNAYHLFVIEINNRKKLYDYLRQNDVLCQVHYIPVYFMPYYKQISKVVLPCHNAENYYSHCLSIPMYPTLKEEEQSKVINLISNFVSTNG
ncbi:UDP-4-amino-4,6-dideoxy-N-acetyl-beta-L-altrosamine transaminase [Verrucomicrobia bacterium]|nr:UDP-4-amino-4,6-dideoxy-N-acetyl-beta-L-altrosamine transaminase [Verrucomicrobiota bacterium]